MEFQYNDGGRAEAGYKGHTGDCVCRAISIATGKPYKEVYDDLNKLSARLCSGYRLVKTAYGSRYEKKSAARTGVNKEVYQNYLEDLGWKWVPTMFIGKGCKVHLDEKELPKGTIIARLSRHLATVIDGVLNDTYDCSRDDTRCVYGYFIKKEAVQ